YAANKTAIDLAKRRRQFLFVDIGSDGMTCTEKFIGTFYALRHSFFSMRYRVRHPVAGRFQPYRYTLPDRYPWLFRFAAAALEGREERKLLSFGCSRGDEVLALRRYFPN